MDKQDDSTVISMVERPLTLAERRRQRTRRDTVDMMKFLVPASDGPARGPKRRKVDEPAPNEPEPVEATTASSARSRRRLIDSDDYDEDIRPPGAAQSAVIEVPRSPEAVEQDEDSHTLEGEEEMETESATRGGDGDRVGHADVPSGQVEDSAYEGSLVVEEFSPLLRSQPPASQSSGAEADAREGWNSKWNGRANFKKFRKAARGSSRQDYQSQPTLNRASVTLVEYSLDDFGIGDTYWAPPRETSHEKVKKNARQRNTDAQDPLRFGMTEVGSPKFAVRKRAGLSNRAPPSAEAVKLADELLGVDQAEELDVTVAEREQEEADAFMFQGTQGSDSEDDGLKFKFTT